VFVYRERKTRRHDQNPPAMEDRVVNPLLCIAKMRAQMPGMNMLLYFGRLPKVEMIRIPSGSI
jgi:hypothetical protein